MYGILNVSIVYSIIYRAIIYRYYVIHRADIRITDELCRTLTKKINGGRNMLYYFSVRHSLPPLLTTPFTRPFTERFTYCPISPMYVIFFDVQKYRTSPPATSATRSTGGCFGSPSAITRLVLGGWGRGVGWFWGHFGGILGRLGVYRLVVYGVVWFLVILYIILE